MSRLALFFVLSLFAFTPVAFADIPHLISLQGRLTDASDNPITSSTNFAFRIYDVSTGGSPLWTEFQTLAPNSLGVFSALLGSVATLNIPFNTSYWLEVQVNSEVLSPRQRMGSAGYALRSESPWNTTGNNVYTTNAGNVGIGTANPQAKLDVSGNIKIADGSQGAGKVLTSDAGGLASWQALSGGQWITNGNDIQNANTGNVIVNKIVYVPQTSPPASPVRGQLYFDANVNTFKFYDGASWKYLDSGYQIYMDSPIGYAGTSHKRQDCANAGGSITTIFGDGSNIDVCKFAAGSCPSGWTQAGSWNTYVSGSGGSGGDVCGNAFSGTSCTTSGVSWSNSGPPASCSFTNCYKTTFIRTKEVHDTQSNLNTRQGAGGIGSIACPVCSADNAWCREFYGGCNNPDDCFVGWSEWSWGCGAATVSPTRTEIGCK